MKKITVNLVSESEFTVQGHGVHTAYLETRHILESNPNIQLMVNAKPQKTTDLTHIHTVGLFAMRRLLSRRGGAKIVSAHIVPDSLIGSIIGAKYWTPIFKYYLRWFYNRADVVIAVSPYTKDELVKLGVKRHIEVVPNSIDTSNFINSPERKAKARRYMIAGDLMFMPSEQETFGLAIIEGAAAGMPVIVRDIPDYDATFGNLVTRSTDDKFINQIRRFMVDNDLYARGQQKSAKLAHKYDSATISKKLLKVYQLAIDQKGKK